MKKYKAILWDTDGTLLDTKGSILRAIEWAYKQEGLREISDEELNSFFGPPAYDNFKRVFGIGHEEAIKLLANFRKHYNEDELYNANVFPYILEVMKDIKDRGYKQGIASYKPKPSLDPLVEHFTFDKYVDVVCGGLDESGKTKKDIMIECIQKMGIDKNDYQNIIMVGDSLHDFNGARELGCDFYGVNYGVGFDDMTEKDKNEPFFLGIYEDARKLLDILQ